MQCITYKSNYILTNSAHQDNFISFNLLAKLQKCWVIFVHHTNYLGFLIWYKFRSCRKTHFRHTFEASRLRPYGYCFHSNLRTGTNARFRSMARLSSRPRNLNPISALRVLRQVMFFSTWLCISVNRVFKYGIRQISLQVVKFSWEL